MNKLKVGIMPRRQFQRRMLDIAAGKIEAERDAPKVWFSSIQSLSEVLNENNVRLLQLIREHQPATLSELATLSGQKASSLSRTLKTMEKYGIVELRKYDRRKVRPIAKATEFDIQYVIA